jgi:hypothetical protein
VGNIYTIRAPCESRDLRTGSRCRDTVRGNCAPCHVGSREKSSVTTASPVDDCYFKTPKVFMSRPPVTGETVGRTTSLRLLVERRLPPCTETTGESQVRFIAKRRGKRGAHGQRVP